MDTSRRLLSTVLLFALTSLFLTGCDSGPQGDGFDREQLRVDGPARVLLPNYDSTAIVPATENPGLRMDVDTARYVNEDYEMGRDFTWSVMGEATALGSREGGASFVVDPPDAPGTYSVQTTTDVGGDQVSGSFATKVDYPSATSQIEQRGQRVLPALLREAGLADALNSDAPNDAVGGYTALFPSDDALRDVFDQNRNGVITDNEIPPADILSKILRYHVLPDSLRLKDAEGGDAQTAFPGHTVFLDPGLTQLVVDAAESEAKTVEPNVATSDGVVHRIDEVLLPTGALSFQDQQAQSAATGDTIRVEGAFAPRSGFVVLYDTEALNSATSDPGRAASIVGTSFKLDRGFNDVITIVTDDPLDPSTGSVSVTAILHYDGDDDGVFDEPDELRPDPRYRRNGDLEPVSAQADIDVGS